jgi:hypothetical protein
MSNFQWQSFYQAIAISKKHLGRRLLILFIISLSLILGWHIEKTLAQNSTNQSNYQLGKQLYLENCSSCHIPIPAEVLPIETWQEILEKPQKHYGTSLPNTISLTTRLIWTYLRTSSRPLLPGETKPEYVTNSRYFHALHPQVDLPKPVTHQSCIVCHPGAQQLDYLTLSSEKQN